MKMTITSGHADFARALTAEAKRMVTAARLSANELGWRGVEAVVQNMNLTFALPRAYVRNGMTVEYARGRDYAEVDWIKPRSKSSGPGAGRVLRAQIEGGRRRDKRLDAALRFLGLPKGLVAVPGPHAKLDAGGDMDGAALRQILRDLKAQGPAIKRKYFVIMNRDGKTKIPRGIYQQAGKDGRPRLVVAFVPEGTYRARFNPAAVVRESVRRNAQEVWQLALQKRLPDRNSRGVISE